MSGNDPIDGSSGHRANTSPTRVTVVYSHDAPFVRRDVEILRRDFEVVPFHWRGKRSIAGLLRTVRRSDVVLSWFAADHAFVAAVGSNLFRRRHYVILGGFDCAAIPELSYGIFLRPIKRRFAVGAVKRSALALPVQRHLVDVFLKNSGLPSMRFEVVPTGYDSAAFAPHGAKEDLVLTVASCTDATNVLRKGVDRFARAASQLSDYEFVVVGPHTAAWREWLAHESGGRLRFAGEVSDEALLDYYRRAKVYCQFSRFEGLPNALCEAMLCECVPCGTALPGIVEAMGDTGVVTEAAGGAGLVADIQAAMVRDGRPARARIVETYPIARRRDALVRILSP